jgi:hypothetical protein
LAPVHPAVALAMRLSAPMMFSMGRRRIFVFMVMFSLLVRLEKTRLKLPEYPGIPRVIKRLFY